MQIYLDKNPLLADKYQQLLLSEWTSETMKESLNLADSFLNTCQHPPGFSELIRNSEVFDNMGFHEAVVECLYIAFRLTAPEEHDYLTKAQAYWTALIDAELFDKAKEFAMRLLRNSPEKHFDEIKEIIELSFKLEKR